VSLRNYDRLLAPSLHQSRAHRAQHDDDDHRDNKCAQSESRGMACLCDARERLAVYVDDEGGRKRKQSRGVASLLRARLDVDVPIKLYRLLDQYHPWSTLSTGAYAESSSAFEFA
jgi:hypothetical protein